MPSTQAPAYTNEPAQTGAPAQTAAPENKPSQKPVTNPTAVPAEPEAQPSQVPPDGNTGEDNKPEGTSQPDGVMEAGNKFVAGNIEFQSTGDGDFTISGIDASTNKNIVIPDTIEIDGREFKVTKIARKAFAGSDIESVQFGSNITEIGEEAFRNCTKLENVELCNDTGSLGDRAFKGCKKLKSVKVPEGLEKIGKGTFRDCESLKKMELPNSVRTIGKKAFKNCKSMKKFTLGTASKKNTKSSNKKLALRFGTTVAKVSIGASALENCVDLRSVVINSQVTKIGNSTFRYCTQLRKMLVKSLKLQKVGNYNALFYLLYSLQGVHNCKITVPPVKIKPYTTLFKNKGQGKKVVVAKS